MAARNLSRTMAAPVPATPIAQGDEDGVLSLDVDDECSMPTLKQTQSYHRASAANFKNLPPQPKKDYRRVVIADGEPSDLDIESCRKIRRAIDLREQWLYFREQPEWLDYDKPRPSKYSVFTPPPYDPFDPELKPASDHVFQWRLGVVSVYADRKSVMRRQAQFQSALLEDFAMDLVELMKIMNDPECRSFCYRRIMLLLERFNMYRILNDGQERLAQIAVPHRDLYNVQKVDVHGT